MLNIGVLMLEYIAYQGLVRLKVLVSNVENNHVNGAPSNLCFPGVL